jgi:hypothetical protein
MSGAMGFQDLQINRNGYQVRIPPDDKKVLMVEIDLDMNNL